MQLEDAKERLGPVRHSVEEAEHETSETPSALENALKGKEFLETW